MSRTILHSDLNNFYASVECLSRPDLKGKPVAVAGDPEMRHGIVLAKNQEAKKCGVCTGEALWIARSKCPDIVFLPPHYDKYLRFSRAAKEIYYQYTDLVESYGLDECWLDVTGSRQLYGDGRTIANEIRGRIKKELGLTVSVGVSFNKVFAKLGSDMKKPNATTVITKEGFKNQIWKLPASQLLYVGKATEAKLGRYGIHTIGELAAADAGFLKSVFGKTGLMLHSFANGLDCSPVSPFGEEPPMKSIGNGITPYRDLKSDEDIKIVLYSLCESVSARLRENHLACRCVHLTIRNEDLSFTDRQESLNAPIRTANAIFRQAHKLLLKNRRSAVRSLSVRATELVAEELTTVSFLPEAQEDIRAERLECTVDRLRSRYGSLSIQRGIMLTDPILSNIKPACRTLPAYAVSNGS